jgi:TPR repeat protein
LRRLNLFALAIAIILSAPAFAAAPTLDSCDRLAAHPNDHDRVRAGVRFAELDAVAAIAACETALAAQPDQARFHFQYARALHKRGRLPAALRAHRRAAKQGYAAAAYALGLIMRDSKVLPGHEKKAFDWVKRAADGGHVLAQFTLGLMHRAGRGVKRSEITAVRWFRIAAAQGLPQAQYNLGWMFEQGLGVERDKVVAAGWYRRAADQGYGRARFALATLEGDPAPFEPRPAEPSRPERVATEPSVASAKSETTTAAGGELAERIATAMAVAEPTAPGEGNIGTRIATGLEAYRAQDYATAFKVWMALARQNVRRAQFYVGGMFIEGRGTAADDVKAYVWLTRAAARGYRPAVPLVSELNERMSGDDLARARALIAGGGTGS